MNTFRTIIVVFVAMSVAMLPVAGGMVIVKSPDVVLTAAQSDCCAPGKPCEQKGTKDCGSLAACALKCFSFSLALAGPAAVTPPAPALAKFARIAQNLSSASDNPPLPPPRV
jgi:hypothetical protein